jgi:hypothetical protein
LNAALARLVDLKAADTAELQAAALALPAKYRRRRRVALVELLLPRPR